MKILITGANGLVGSRLARQLSERGHQVLALARGPQRLAAKVPYSTTDLTDGEATKRAFEGFAPEAVIHPASMTEVDRCEKDPEGAYAGNVTATENIAEASRLCGAHLVHVSTDYVFDGEHGPYSEEEVPNPRGTYALTKHLAEQVVRVLAPSWAIARTAVVFGWPPSARPNFGSWLYSTLKSGQTVKLFEDQFVSPSLAENVAQMLGELAERKLSGIWNICGADVVNRIAVGKAMCEVFGFDPKLLIPTRMKDLNLLSPRPLRSGLKVDKAKRELKAQPLSLADALKAFRSEIEPV